MRRLLLPFTHNTDVTNRPRHGHTGATSVSSFAQHFFPFTTFVVHRCCRRCSSARIRPPPQRSSTLQGCPESSQVFCPTGETSGQKTRLDCEHRGLAEGRHKYSRPCSAALAIVSSRNGCGGSKVVKRSELDRLDQASPVTPLVVTNSPPAAAAALLDKTGHIISSTREGSLCSFI